jgi:hypothetical protein
MSGLISGREEFGGCSLQQWAVGDAPAPYSGLMPAMARRLETQIPDLGAVALEAPPLIARVDHGRWVVDCPCGSSSMVWTDNPLLWCMSCGNADVNHRWRRVSIPGPEIRDQIEELLMVRPKENRIWNPNESIEDLRRENEEHASELLVT